MWWYTMFYKKNLNQIFSKENYPNEMSYSVSYIKLAMVMKQLYCTKFYFLVQGKLGGHKTRTNLHIKWTNHNDLIKIKLMLQHARPQYHGQDKKSQNFNLNLDWRTHEENKSFIWHQDKTIWHADISAGQVMELNDPIVLYT